jgi:hypothetical protein
MSNIARPNGTQGRAGNALSCANCGKRLNPKRSSRRMRFCSGGCWQSAFCAREAKKRRAKPVAPHQTSTPCRSSLADLKADAHARREAAE